MIAIKNQTEGWPEYVWRRTGEEFCRNTFVDQRGRCCLIGMARNDFHRGKQDAVHKAIHVVLLRRGQTLHYRIADWNDNILHSLQEIADVWNEAMVELGYTEEFEQ